MLSAVATKKAEIATARLVLEPLAPSSIAYTAPLFALLNDWEVAKMLAQVPWPLRYEDVSEFLAAQPNVSGDDFAVLGASGPIGVATVKRPGSGEPPRSMPRLGYWIGRKFWRQGFGGEAIGALVDFAFRTYPSEKIGAGVFLDNIASRRLLEKLGFTDVGRNSIFSRSRGKDVETADMQITRAAWAARQPALQ